MNITEFAAKLNGREYTKEITKEEEQEAKSLGFVVVFGGSDDLMEFQGAIYDEFGCYDGGTCFIDSEGLLPDRESIEEDDELEKYFIRKKANPQPLEAVWASEGYSWTYNTKIPHACFDIMDGDDKYCRGIVFSLDALNEDSHG